MKTNKIKPVHNPKYFSDYMLIRKGHKYINIHVMIDETGNTFKIDINEFIKYLNSNKIEFIS